MIDDRTLQMIDAYLDGELDAAGHAALIERVNSDPAVAAAFVRASFDDRRFRDDLVGRNANGAHVMPVAHDPITSQSRRLPFGAIVGVAAALAFAAVVAYYAWPTPAAPRTAPSAPIATVIDATGDLLIGNDIAIAGHDYPARPVSLRSGSAEFQLTSGANVRIVGPVELDLRDAMHSTLRSGFASFDCPETAHGYLVDLPGGAKVIDLGTRFATRIDADGVTRIAVDDGAVLVRAADGAERGLMTDQAVAIDPDGSMIDLPMLDVAGASRFVRWTFDEADGLDLHDTGRGFEASQAARLAWGKPGIEGPDRITGRVNRALAFDGKNDYVATEFPGIAGDHPRTVAMWVRIPHDAQVSDSLALFSYGRFEAGRVWQMSWNSYAQDGAIGALRLGVLGRSLVGKTDLRDSVWHHLAAVYDGHTARLYVDGRLDASMAIGRIDTAVGSGAGPVTLGRNIAAGAGGYFRGAIDEVVVVDDALTPSQITELMKHVSPGR